MKKQIFDAICKFYKFYMVSNRIFLRTIKENLNVSVCRKYDQHTYEYYFSFTSIHNIIEKILKWADVFKVHEHGKTVACMKNVFLGCKTLEDVLIVKDLHSDSVEAEL